MFEALSKYEWRKCHRSKYAINCVLRFSFSDFVISSSMLYSSITVNYKSRHISTDAKSLNELWWRWWWCMFAQITEWDVCINLDESFCMGTQTFTTQQNWAKMEKICKKFLAKSKIKHESDAHCEQAIKLTGFHYDYDDWISHTQVKEFPCCALVDGTHFACSNFAAICPVVRFSILCTRSGEGTRTFKFMLTSLLCASVCMVDSTKFHTQKIHKVEGTE